ncbi:MAG: DUF1080 domain-containing protein [Planctomycetes bacterium]|nr:DUF1080 domain-containing protein [Planctomycetota bacterium]
MALLLPLLLSTAFAPHFSSITAADVVAIPTPLPAQNAAGIEPLFNGTDLTGWSGDLRYWTVKNGEIIGRSTAEQPLPQSTYLYWDGEASNFELNFDYRIIGGNSGVQYRSRRLENDDVAGYQADFEAGPNHTGILYESNGRGIMAKRGEHFELLADGQKVQRPLLGSAEKLQSWIQHEQWNHYRVVANGPRLIHEINGHRMIDVIDRSAQASSSGTFAIQLHAGPAMEVRYKNMQLRRLKTSDFSAEPEWIWGFESPGDNEVRYFAHAFELSEAAEIISGAFTADNSFQLWLDGEKIATGNNWSQPTRIADGIKLESGWHVLALQAANEGGPAGVLGILTLRNADGQRRQVLTSENWLHWKEAPLGWPNLSAPLSSSGVPSRTFGPASASAGPWGNVMRKAEAPNPIQFTTADGLVVERIYSAQPGEGSWASMTFGEDGLLYVSPERGRLLQFNLSHILRKETAQNLNGFQIDYECAPPEVIPFDLGSAQGLEWAFDSLYLNVAGNPNGNGGLHRLQDKDGDGVFDHQEHLARYGPGGEHGAHGIRKSPDGWLYLVHGNHTKPPVGMENQSIMHAYQPFQNGAEDVLLARLWDPRGHAKGVMAPGGELWRTDERGSTWQRVAAGMRNSYDIAISTAGEVFTYDSDMEWDLGAPWYRPPRVLHLVPGAEFGWRSGSAKWPATYPYSLPAISNTDLSSPTGVELLAGSRFPAKYQNALILGDWAWGRILCMFLEPDGASFSGDVQLFLKGRGLTVTDMEIGPDGWLWFIIGGRGTQSGLYRVRHMESGQAQELAAPPLLAQRRNWESWQPSGDDAQAEIQAMSEGNMPKQWLLDLAHNDAHIANAARNALERAFSANADLSWRQLGLAKHWPHPAALQAGIAWIRSQPTAAIPSMVKKLATSAESKNLAALPVASQRLILRMAMLAQTRWPQDSIKDPTPKHWQSLRKSLVKQFPLADETANQMLAELLVYLQADQLPTLFLYQLHARSDQQNQLYYASLLRLVSQGWTFDLRLRYFLWLQQSDHLQGGASLKGFIQAIEKEARLHVSEEEWNKLQPELEARRQATEASANSAMAVQIQRSFHRDWNLNDAIAAVATQSPQADVVRGSRVFNQALCIQCHRFDGRGSYLGPDLSAVGQRFMTKDILQAVINPGLAKSDQYANIQMPPGLLNTMKAQDLADLIKFLEGAKWPAE